MQTALVRRNGGFLSRWWWTVDRPLFVAVAMLMAIGAILVAAASPVVAERIGLDAYYFVRRQQVFLFLGFVVMVLLSFISPRSVRRFAMIGLVGSVFLMLLVPIIGYETKGAARWINVAGISIQPSEFMKPFFAVIIGWIFSLKSREGQFPSFKISAAVYGVVVLLLLLQPDFGMTVTISLVWGVQLFLAGLPLYWVLLLGILAVGGGVGAYFGLSHVRARIDRFLDPQSGDNYQVEKSLEAFQNGGLLGKGPGEGEVKLSLPDSHTDFIFAVAGEEFGLLFCLVIVSLFLFILLRSLYRLRQEQDLFVMLAVGGLVTQLGIQALINMGVSVQLLPAKGMTLPFLSYGGSSMIAVCVGMGMILALTRKRFGGIQV